jgi:hypothetical protein
MDNSLKLFRISKKILFLMDYTQTTYQDILNGKTLTNELNKDIIGLI